MSDDKHVTLVEFTKKAAESFDAAESVRELLRRIESGRLKPEKILMHIVELDTNGKWLPQLWKANVTGIEALALTVLSQDDIIREIKGDD